MPVVRNWFRSGIHKDMWRHRDYDIIVRIKGSRGKWFAVIEDKEFNRFSRSIQKERYIAAKFAAVDAMKVMNRGL